MHALICDPSQVEAIIKHRQECGGDRYDEVWDGLYIISPTADIEHQRIISQLIPPLFFTIVEEDRGKVYPGVNVTDSAEDWTKNYRVPDMAVVMNTSQERCRNIGDAFCGGPDFLIEVRSPGDRSFDKLDFYASIGVREFLIVDRDTKAINLFKFQSRQTTEVKPKEGWLESEVVGLAFRTGSEPVLEVRTTQPPERSWKI